MKLTPYRKKAIKLTVISNLSLLLVVVAYLLIADLLSSVGLFNCVFQNVFHLYCPGCGGTRSLSHLIRLDFYSALIAYPPVAAILFFYLDLNLRAVLSITRDDYSIFQSFNVNYLISIPVLILINFVVRNLLLFFGIDMLGDLSVFYGISRF